METVLNDINDFIHMSHHWLDNRLAPTRMQDKLHGEERAFIAHQNKLKRADKIQLCLIHHATERLIMDLMDCHQLYEIDEVLDKFVIINQMIEHITD